MALRPRLAGDRVDISQVALDRAAVHAEEAGVGLDLRIYDVMGEEPVSSAVGEFDLVSVQFMHVPRPTFDDVYGRLASGVAPGGRLLVVGHHPDDVATGARRPHGPDLLFGPEQVVAAVSRLGEVWSIETSDAPERTQDTEDGPVQVRDSVVVAVRQ